MKKLILGIGCLALVACTPSTSVPSDYQLLLKQTDGFEDCKIVVLDNGSGNRLYVVRCPNSTTSTTRGGKHPVRTVVKE